MACSDLVSATFKTPKHLGTAMENKVANLSDNSSRRAIGEIVNIFIFSKKIPSCCVGCPLGFGGGPSEDCIEL